MEQADERSFGCVLCNDWSARDVQKFEYVPLAARNSAQFGAIPRNSAQLCDAVLSHSQVYETTITNIQLQEQLKVTKNYQKDVTRVLKEVDVLQSQTNAEIVEIDAQAARESAVVVNEAEAAALQLEQGTKAVWCAALKEAHVVLSHEPTRREYDSMRAIQSMLADRKFDLGDLEAALRRELVTRACRSCRRPCCA